MNEALDGLEEGDAGRDEDGKHNRVAGPPLSTFTAQEKSGADGDRGEGVTGVVD